MTRSGHLRWISGVIRRSIAVDPLHGHLHGRALGLLFRLEALVRNGQVDNSLTGAGGMRDGGHRSPLAILHLLTGHRDVVASICREDLPLHHGITSSRTHNSLRVNFDISTRSSTSQGETAETRHAAPASSAGRGEPLTCLE